MARPRKKIDEKQVLELARIGCTVPEMAVILDVSQSTLNHSYCKIINKGREDGKERLRRLQWKSAQKGNVAMLIWLGKQVLKQADKQEQSGPNGGPVQTEIKLTIEHIGAKP